MDSDKKYFTPNKYNSNIASFRMNTYGNSSSGGGRGSGGNSIFNLQSNLKKVVTPRRSVAAASCTSLIAKEQKNNSSPFRKVINPFEAALTERLHLPLIDSPSLFRLPSTPQLSSTQFEWTIEEVSSLNPANVEAHDTQFISTIDPVIEAKAQAAINSYFKETLEVPSPIDCPLRQNKIILRNDEIDYEYNTISTQTELTFPNNLPIFIEELITNFIERNHGDEEELDEEDEQEITTETENQQIYCVPQHNVIPAAIESNIVVDEDDNLIRNSSFGFLSPINKLLASKLKCDQLTSITNSITKRDCDHGAQSPFSSSFIFRSTPEKRLNHRRHRSHSIDSIHDSYATNNTATTTVGKSMTDFSNIKINKSDPEITPVKSVKRLISRKNLQLSFDLEDCVNAEEGISYNNGVDAINCDTDHSLLTINSKGCDVECQTELTLFKTELTDEFNVLLNRYCIYSENQTQKKSPALKYCESTDNIDHAARDASLKRKLFDICYNINNNLNSTQSDNELDNLELKGLSPLAFSPDNVMKITNSQYFGTPPNQLHKSMNLSMSPIYTDIANTNSNTNINNNNHNSNSNTNINSNNNNNNNVNESNNSEFKHMDIDITSFHDNTTEIITDNEFYSNHMMSTNDLQQSLNGNTPINNKQKVKNRKNLSNFFSSSTSNDYYMEQEESYDLS